MSRYATPSAFKEALEARLRARAREAGHELNRLRMRLIMDRFAARVIAEYQEDVVLKGGVVLELRLAVARATKDLDMRLVGDPLRTLARLQRAGRQDLGEHMAFEVVSDPRHPTIDAEGMTYEGLRFRVQARLAGKIYGGPFGVDAAFAEPMVGAPELVLGSDFLSFADIEPPVLRVYPLETHIAEKLHAYTLPRTRPNSRVKDLPDLALLARVRPLRSGVLREAIEVTFAHRAVHHVPGRLPDPPESWRVPYARLARRDRLPWDDLDEVLGAAREFFHPVLAGRDGAWSPESWRWEDDR